MFDYQLEIKLYFFFLCEPASLTEISSFHICFCTCLYFSYFVISPGHLARKQTNFILLPLPQIYFSDFYASRLLDRAAVNQPHRCYWPIIAFKWNRLYKKRLANPLLVEFIEKILKFAKILIAVARCPVKRTRAKRPSSIIETDIPHLHGSNCWRIEISIMECHHCIKTFVHHYEGRLLMNVVLVICQ